MLVDELSLSIHTDFSLFELTIRLRNALLQTKQTHELQLADNVIRKLLVRFQLEGAVKAGDVRQVMRLAKWPTLIKRSFIGKPLTLDEEAGVLPLGGLQRPKP